MEWVLVEPWLASLIESCNNTDEALGGRSSLPRYLLGDSGLIRGRVLGGGKESGDRRAGFVVVDLLFVVIRSMFLWGGDLHACASSAPLEIAFDITSSYCSLIAEVSDLVWAPIASPLAKTEVRVAVREVMLGFRNFVFGWGRCVLRGIVP